MTTPVGYGRPGVFTIENFAPLSNNNAAVPGEALPAFAALYNRGPLAPTLITSWQHFTSLYGGFSASPGNLLPFAVNQFFANGGVQCFIARIPNTDATTASAALEDVAVPTPSAILTVSAASPGAWGNQVYAEVVSAGQAGRVNVNVYYSGTAASNLVETFQDVSMNPVDVRNIVTVINSPVAGSNYIQVTETLPGGIYTAGSTDLALIPPTPLSGGGDGSNAPGLDDSTHGAPPVFDQLINQALYINFPGLDSITTLANLNAWAETRGDVMLVIDGPAPAFPETEAEVAQNYISMTQGTNALPQSTYLTVYAPWIQVADPSSTVVGATRWLPPGGAVLGVWQSTDIRYGTVQSPAGIQATLNAIQLEVNFSNNSLDLLNNAYVNAIKFIPTIGICIFGARTLHPGYPDRYVAVRRMIIKLEHDLKWITQYALFQPNDARLWASITTTITTYLTQLMQAGQLGGTTPDNSFQVICNSTNNTLATAAAGIVNCTVAVSLLSPAEYIYITLSQFQGTQAQQTTVSTSSTSA
jgi:hypothetical protein